jgi:hypothetical protein
MIVEDMTILAVSHGEIYNLCDKAHTKVKAELYLLLAAGKSGIASLVWFSVMISY